MSAVVALLAALSFGAGTASATPANELRSFPGCPLLLESRSSGPCVQALQTYLNIVYGGYGLVEDGQFGAPTRIAVLDFQGRNHLPADGNVGGTTADELLAQVDEIRVQNVPTVSNPVPPGDGGAAAALGRPAAECMWERVKDKVPADLLTDIGARRLNAKELAGQLSRYLLPWDVAKVVWCVSFEKAN